MRESTTMRSLVSSGILIFVLLVVSAQLNPSIVRAVIAPGDSKPPLTEVGFALDEEAAVHSVELTGRTPSRTVPIILCSACEPEFYSSSLARSDTVPVRVAGLVAPLGLTLAVLVGLGTVFTSSLFGRSSQKSAGHDDARMAAIEKHFAMEDAKKTAEVLSTFADGITWESVARRIQLFGKTSVGNNYDDTFRSMERIDGGARSLHRFVHDKYGIDDSIVKFIVTGPDVDYEGIPIGSKVEMRVLHLFEFSGDKIVKELVFEIPRILEDQPGEGGPSASAPRS